MPPPILIQLTFTSHTGSLFLSLYAPRYCLTASAGFGRQFAKLRALSRLRRRYDSRKKRPPFVPLPSFPVPFWEPPRALAKQLKHFCAFMQCFIARKLHFIHTLGIIYGEKLWITWTTKWG